MDRNDLRLRIVAMLNEIRRHRGEEPIELPDDQPLDARGWGLDSLDLAELSSTLELSMGHDPYSTRRFPLTVREIVAYYESSAE